MSACCNSSNCRRTREILINRGPLSGRWYAVTRYKDLGDGNIEAQEKHDITEQITGIINQALAQKETQ